MKILDETNNDQMPGKKTTILVYVDVPDNLDATWDIVKSAHPDPIDGYEIVRRGDLLGYKVRFFSPTKAVAEVNVSKKSKPEARRN